MNRREVVRGMVATAMATAGPRTVAGAFGSRINSALFFVPGYRPDQGSLDGLPLHKHPALTAGLPRGYDGPLTLVTRLDESDRSMKRALMPVKGHHVAIDPRGHQAFFSALDDGHMARFDPRSLALIDTVEPHADGFVGGGHSAWTGGGRHLVMTERRPYARFTGNIADHRGRIVIRDGDTLKVLEVYESHGIAPHDLTLMENDGLVAVANYGSTWQADAANDAKNPFQKVEPRLSLIDLDSGRLVDRFAPKTDAYEVRHVAARDREHLFAIASAFQREQDVAPMLAGRDKVGPPNTNASSGMDFAPAPLYAVRRSGEGQEAVALLPSDPLDFREGQTVVYDPVHDEAIATFASSHTIAVVDAGTFDLKRVIATDRLGLYFPRGIALHPDGARYVVSGSWSGLYVFARGRHDLDRAATWDEVFFHHSHITAAPAGPVRG